MDWNAMAAPWLRLEAATDAAHAPVLAGLMDRAGLGPGHRVVDIGPGAGISLLHVADAVGDDGHVTGVEIAPPFAERARARVPGHVTVVEADAQDHGFAPGSFDAAVSLFGVMFFRDSVAALRNIRAGLKPGARFSFACWGPPQDNPWFALPARVAAEVFGPGPKPDPAAPGPMRFADPGALHALMQDAGWQPQVETVDLHLTPLGGPVDVADMMMTIGAASSRMEAEDGEGRLTDDHKAAVHAGLRAGFAQMVQDGGVRVPARINFVTATA
jgi:SAM-dependent methyltransferase